MTTKKEEKQSGIERQESVDNMLGTVAGKSEFAESVEDNKGDGFTPTEDEKDVKKDEKSKEIEEKTYDDKGYDEEGFDKDGFNDEGFDKEGKDSAGKEKEKEEEKEFDEEGFDSEGFNKDGFDKDGFDSEGFDENNKDVDGKEKKEEEDTVESLKERNETLVKTIANLSKPTVKPKTDDIDTSDEEEEDEPIKEKKSKDRVFITQEELDKSEDDIGVSAEFLNKFGNMVANQITKETLTKTTNVVKSHIDERQKLQKITDDFYKDNSDLATKEIQPFVGFRASQLAAEHPDWSYEKLFKELGDDVRENLGLKKKAVELENGRKKKPAFVKKQKSKKPSSSSEKEETGIQKEIDKMMPNNK